MGGFLELHVNRNVNPDDPALNGLYYKAPAANIKSLTIRGTDDNETIRIEGDLGISGNVYIDGKGGSANGGSDEVILDFTGIAGDGHHYTIGGDAEAGWDMRLNRTGKPAIDSKAVNKYTLLTGPGADVIRVEKSSGALTRWLHVNAGDGYDEVFVGSPLLGVSDIASDVYTNGAAGSAKVTYLDAVSGTSNFYVWGLSDKAGSDIRINRFGMAASAYFVGVDKYTLQAGGGADKVHVDATAAAATQGNFVFGNGANDTIRVGTDLDGLGKIATFVTADGGNGDDTLTVEDKASPAGRTYQVTALDVARTNGPTINYLSITDLVLKAAPASTANVKSSPAGTKVQVVLDFDANHVNVGNAANRLDDILGSLDVVGSIGTDHLTFTDSGHDKAETYTVRADRVEVNRLAGVTLTFSALEQLAVSAGGGPDQVNLDGLTAAVKLTANGGAPAPSGGPPRDTLAMVAGHANDPALSGFEELAITGGKLTLNTTALSVEHMTQSGGTLEGTAEVSASISLAWSGGTMQGTGKTVSLNTSTLTLTGSPTLAARTLENHGTGNWNGATIGGVTGTLRNTGYLSGTGTLAGKLVNDGSLLPAGAGPIGTITVQGAFESAGTFAADLGATADQVAAQTVTLGGTFSPTSVAGFPAKSYTVIDNTGANPVNGTFAGLPEGAVLTVNGVRYQITYVGGTGNDVVLHAVVNVGDRVWEDFNLDGIQNDGVPSLPPMAVQLYTPSHVLVAETMASATGEYLFANVRVGDYYLKFGLPGDGWYKFTRKDWTDDALDSDADPTIGNIGKTAEFTLSPGQDDLTRDAGVYKLGTVGDLVWLDYYIGGDGIQMMPPDGGPISGLAVTLVSTPSGYGGATTTGSSGYLFEKVELVDANWNPISYRVQFTKPPDTTSPDGSTTRYVFSPMDQGTDDALDSDADPATGLTGPFTLPKSGAVNRTIDCGIQYSQFSGGGYVAASDLGSESYPDGLAIQGRMWSDGDGDGVRDPLELPVAGWRVGLYTPGGELAAETWTGADGAYEFAGVTAGLYRVRFDPPGAGLAFTLRDRGGDDALDSDVDPDGYSSFFANINPGPWVASLDAGLVRGSGVSIDPSGLWADEDDPDYLGGTSRQRWHRDLLRRAMEAEGFAVYEAEWWHFDYQDWRKYPILDKRFEELSGK